MGTGGKVKSSLNIPVLRRLEAACLALAAMTAVAQLGALLLVIGGTVLTFWAVSGMLLAASATLRLVSNRAARCIDVPPFAAYVRLLRSIVASALSDDVEQLQAPLLQGAACTTNCGNGKVKDYDAAKKVYAVEFPFATGYIHQSNIKRTRQAPPSSTSNRIPKQGST